MLKLSHTYLLVSFLNTIHLSPSSTLIWNYSLLMIFSVISLLMNYTLNNKLSRPWLGHTQQQNHLTFLLVAASLTLLKTVALILVVAIVTMVTLHEAEIPWSLPSLPIRPIHHVHFVWFVSRQATQLSHVVTDLIKNFKSLLVTTSLCCCHFFYRLSVVPSY